jgi:hypothetical protein
MTGISSEEDAKEMLFVSLLIVIDEFSASLTETLMSFEFTTGGTTKDWLESNQLLVRSSAFAGLSFDDGMETLSVSIFVDEFGDLLTETPQSISIDKALSSLCFNYYFLF